MDEADTVLKHMKLSEKVSMSKFHFLKPPPQIWSNAMWTKVAVKHQSSSSDLGYISNDIIFRLFCVNACIHTHTHCFELQKYKT